MHTTSRIDNSHTTTSIVTDKQAAEANLCQFNQLFAKATQSEMPRQAPTKTSKRTSKSSSKKESGRPPEILDDLVTISSSTYDNVYVQSNPYINGGASTSNNNNNNNGREHGLIRVDDYRHNTCTNKTSINMSSGNRVAFTQSRQIPSMNVNNNTNNTTDHLTFGDCSTTPDHGGNDVPRSFATTHHERGTEHTGIRQRVEKKVESNASSEQKNFGEMSTKKTAGEWDAFRLLPPKSQRVNRGVYLNICLKMLKLCTFLVLFVLTLGSAIVAKSTFLLLTSGISTAGRNVSICTDKIPEAEHNTVSISGRHAAKWAWATLFALCMPELMCFVWCLHRTVFRRVKRPTAVQFCVVFIVETLNAYSTSAIVFEVLPYTTVYTGIMLSNALCFIPSVLSTFSRGASRWLPFLISLDLLAIFAQGSIFWALPVHLPDHVDASSTYVYLTLISLAWWQNFVHSRSFLRPVRHLAAFAERLMESASKTYTVVTVWKCVLYAFCMFHFVISRITFDDLTQPNLFGERMVTIVASHLNQSQISQFQERMHEYELQELQLSSGPEFRHHQPAEDPSKPWNPDREPNTINVNGETKSTKTGSFHRNTIMPEKSESAAKKKEKLAKKNKETFMKSRRSDGVKKGNNNKRKIIRRESLDGNIGGATDGTSELLTNYNIYEDSVELNQYTTPYDALYIALFQVVSVIVCYHSSKFACKVIMQRFGFSLPMLLVSPLAILVLGRSCRRRASDACEMTSLLPKEVFWQCHYDDDGLPPDVWLLDFWLGVPTLIWLSWLLAQLWTTVHLWMPRHERLARSEKLFVLSYYNGAFIDQSLALNRRRDDKKVIRFKDLTTYPHSAYGSDRQFFEDYPQLSSPTMVKHFSGIGESPTTAYSGGLFRSVASSADAVCKIFVCATMWHESAEEMRFMLRSIMRMDEDQAARRNAQTYLSVVDPDYYEFEAHIFLDDAFERRRPTADGTAVAVNKFARNLVAQVDTAASAVHQTTVALRRPTKMATPYGGRLTYVLPGGNQLHIHLKDSRLVKQRKRWSQVMYLYYLLGYQLLLRIGDEKRRRVIAEHTFFLTLDGDVDFTPECVHLLVDLMKKNRKLGAACGRIHPRGSGLMIWYQKFEYAVGHWLQKATEHMIGCVLCSPGCFSLFRAHALMDDNVTRKYATESVKPIHYVQYDQGEDRWLCTLLLQRGYRVEYCAASDALTFAPEGFNEFFNQRRRWIPSTLANIVDLLRDYRNVVAVNESISIWYIVYQCIMFISSILGPGTIFIMIVGALSISFNIDTRLALVVVALPVVLFCVCCFVGKPENQLLCAQLIGALFAMLMTAVIVGTSLQIQKDSIMSPHSIFLFAVIASFTIAGILHPCEFGCVVYFVLYFLAIPCMYMILPIYSITNLNTVSWGTREEKSGDHDGEELPDDAKRGDSGFKRGGDGLVNYDLVDDTGRYRSTLNMESEVSIGCGSACQLLCCLRPSVMNAAVRPVAPLHDKKHSSRCFDGVAEKPKMPHVIGVEHHPPSARSPRGDASNGGSSLPRPPMSAPAQPPLVLVPSTESEDGWLNDPIFSGFARHHIDAEERRFWLGMIERYLRPVSTDPAELERIREGLTALRNRVCSAFFMLNVVFIVVVLILQMQKDCLHVEWPLGPTFNRTVVPCNSDSGQEVWITTRLQLEPIGLVFLVFFMSILIIQFIAMLMHRIGTLAHIIAATPLFRTRPTVDREVEMARELQAIRSVDRIVEPPSSFALTSKGQERRQNVYEPRRESSIVPHPTTVTGTLDESFRKRFFAISRANDMTNGKNIDQLQAQLTLRKSTIKALQKR